MRTNASYLLLLVLVASGCVRDMRKVSFQHDVRPILQKNCLECHTPLEGEGYMETGLTMQTYGELMQGTLYGPVIIPGDSRHSILNMLVEGRVDRSIRMPHGRDPLASKDIETLRLWVEQGARNN